MAWYTHFNKKKWRGLTSFMSPNLGNQYSNYALLRDYLQVNGVCIMLSYCLLCGFCGYQTKQAKSDLQQSINIDTKSNWKTLSKVK